MSVTKPDATKFDADSDSISASRPELLTLVNSFNTIADEYNAGTLGGVNLGTPVVGDTLNSTDQVETLSNPYTQFLSNQSSSATPVYLKFDAQPLDTVWRVLVVRNAPETGYSRIYFTLDGGEDSAGGYTSGNRDVTVVGTLFEIYKYSDPKSAGDIFIDIVELSVESRYTP